MEEKHIVCIPLMDRSNAYDDFDGQTVDETCHLPAALADPLLQ